MFKSAERARSFQKLVNKQDMKTTHTFSVDMIIRRSKANQNQGLLYARITIDGEIREISLKEKIEVSSWDSKSETVIGRSIQAKTINNLIAETRHGIKDKYRLLRAQNQELTAENVKQAFLGVSDIKKAKTLFELLDYFTQIFGDKLKHGGFKNYRTTIAYIKAFVANRYSRRTLYASEVDIQFATDFEYYIRHEPMKKHDPCLGNGVSKHIQRFKRIMNWAAEIKWVKSNEIERYKCPIKKSKRKKLTMQEILLLEHKPFQDSNLNYVRDLFIFCCYTSFAYIDVMTLTEADFEFQANGNIWCKKYRVKSDELQHILLLKPAAQILHKYRTIQAETGGKAIFPYISNQTVNRCLRIIQEACEINTPITFHVARHTFAKTIALNNGVPLETIQQIMGHTKITTTQVYADVDEDKIRLDIQRLEAMLEEKRKHYNNDKLRIG